MANFEVQENYNTIMRMLETTDPNHADTFNLLFQQLLNNDAFIKALAEKMINQANIVHNTEVNSTSKIPSAAVTAALALGLTELENEVDETNNNLTYRNISSYITVNNEYCSDIMAYTENGMVFIKLKITAGWNELKQIATLLDSKYFPRTSIPGIYFPGTSQSDSGKYIMSYVNGSGVIACQLSSNLNYEEYVVFTYPARYV